MARNCQLKNIDNLKVYPVTLAKNVYLSNGKTLEDMLTEIINGNFVAYEPFTPNIATKYSLGEVIVGNGLSIDSNGVLSVNNNSVNGVFSLNEIYKNSNKKNINIYSYSEV